MTPYITYSTTNSRSINQHRSITPPKCTIIEPCVVCGRNRLSKQFLTLNPNGSVTNTFSGAIVASCNIIGECVNLCNNVHLHKYLQMKGDD